MTATSSLKWIPAAIAACIMAGVSRPAWTQELDESALTAYPSSSDEDDSDIAETEGYLPTRVTLADLFPAGKQRMPFIVGARAEHQFGTDLDNAGEFSVTRYVGAAAVMFPLGERLGGIVGGGYGFANYDFDNDDVFGGEEPWGDIQSTHFGGAIKYLINRNWSMIGGGFGAYAGETDADASSSFTGGGFLGGAYRSSEKLYIQAGVTVHSQLDDDPLLFPAFRFNWVIDDHWQLRAGVLESGATDTVGASVIYHFDDHWSVTARAGYVNRRFRLDDSGFAPEGIGQDSNLRGALSLNWRPDAHLQITAIGGMTFGGNLLIEDDGGDRLFKEDYDPTPFVAIRMGLRF